MRILTVLGTRPEIIKLSRIIPKFDEYFKNYLIHTGQNYDYELNKIFFKDLSIRKPDFFLKAATNNNIETISNIIHKFGNICKKIKPDAVFILGDTNSGLAAITAKKFKIPIFHYEAGNRCFDINVPEEINRKIIDHISDINLTYSQIAKQYLIKEGIPSKNIIKVGSPMKEIFNYNYKKIQKSQILKKLNLKKENFILVSFHREENVDDDKTLKNFVYLLKSVCKKTRKKIIISTHSRLRKNLKKLKHYRNKNLIFLKPLGFFDYINLMQNSYVCLSDSGTITEEASILKIPAINLRDTNERPEGMEEGTVMMTGTDLDKVMTAIKILKNKRNKLKIPKLIKDYNINFASEKIVKIILSYKRYINKYSWLKKNI